MGTQGTHSLNGFLQPRPQKQSCSGGSVEATLWVWGWSDLIEANLFWGGFTAILFCLSLVSVGWSEHVRPFLTSTDSQESDSDIDSRKWTRHCALGPIISPDFLTFDTLVRFGLTTMRVRTKAPRSCLDWYITLLNCLWVSHNYEGQN